MSETFPSQLQNSDLIESQTSRQIFFYKVRTAFTWLCVTLKTATSATSVSRPVATNSSGTGRNGWWTAV